MGDNRRFDLFAKHIERQFPHAKNLKIADVAAGQGFLSLALNEKGFTNITSFDKRYKKVRQLKDYRYKYFHWQIEEQFDLIVGMHTDEATDHAILYAVKNRIPFTICPCCVKPNGKLFHGQHAFWPWVKHLKQMAESAGFEIFESELPMSGRRWVLTGKPFKQRRT